MAHARRDAITAVLAIASGATAQTVVPGGNLINQTWTPAGSPYIVQGDVIVPLGSTLTIQPGTTVLAASSDSQAAGIDHSRVEITINGTLSCVGTATAPIAFRAQSGAGSAIWFGLVINQPSSAAIAEASIQNTAEGILTTTPNMSLSRVSFSAFRDYGVLLSGGSLTADRCTFVGGFDSIDVPAGDGTFTNCFFSAPSNGVFIGSSSFTGTLNLVGCTFSQCSTYGIWGVSGTGTVNVRNCIITRTGSIAINRAAGGPTVNVTYSDVFSPTGTNYAGAAPGSGCISADPLLFSPTDPRLNPGSPCIDSGSAPCTGPDLFGAPRPQGSGCDMGAAEFASACYANCDGSSTVPILNVLDFTCFLQKFAAAYPYANCDGSTVAPVLNVIDFTCFLQKYAAGCT